MNLSISEMVQKTWVQFGYPAKQFWLQSALLAGAVLFCYAGLFASLVQTWWSNDVYSHGFLVPFISLYIVWLRRGNLVNLPLASNYVWGLPVVLAGLTLRLGGNAGGVLLAEEFSLIITVAGMVLLLLGVAFLKVLWFPITYLLFMLPSWGIMIDRLHFPFQKFSAILGTAMLQMIGVPAFRQSIFIELPNITLEVAKVCSGVSYLIAILAMAVALASIVLRSWPRKILLVGGAVVIGILTNSLRIAFIGALSYHQISESLHGPYHILQGLVVSQIGFVVLFLGTWSLSKRPAVLVAVPRPSASFEADVRPKLILKGLPGYPLSILTAMLLLVGGYLHFFQPRPVPLKMELTAFPFSVGPWWGSDGGSGYGAFGVVDASLSRTYRTASGKALHFYIGYYEAQSQGRELVNYESGAFHRASVPMQVGLNGGKSLEVNRLIDQKTNRVILFWYDLNGRTATDRFLAKAYTTWDTLVRGSSNGAVIVVSGEFTQSDPDPALSDAEAFIREIVPVLRGYLPPESGA
ncbi:exosortase W [Candidatus Manganitrophus noduliformans]|uniref:EpsI family protein n=1 Tax=Candidatus Manganitrophus noduliformans TaxID=2606439 RepID=A0A7X6DRL7_9BACT|nr:exosortase W [Candidatus Manganitrophus noduliformans]NKE72106.1 EpsI family protein [Candidatus Manganitrophus noduliformans]